MPRSNHGPPLMPQRSPRRPHALPRSETGQPPAGEERERHGLSAHSVFHRRTASSVWPDSLQVVEKKTWEAEWDKRKWEDRESQRGYVWLGNWKKTSAVSEWVRDNCRPTVRPNQPTDRLLIERLGTAYLLLPPGVGDRSHDCRTGIGRWLTHTHTHTLKQVRGTGRHIALISSSLWQSTDWVDLWQAIWSRDQINVFPGSLLFWPDQLMFDVRYEFDSIILIIDDSLLHSTLIDVSICLIYPVVQDNGTAKQMKLGSRHKTVV